MDLGTWFLPLKPVIFILLPRSNPTHNMRFSSAVLVVFAFLTSTLAAPLVSHPTFLWRKHSSHPQVNEAIVERGAVEVPILLPAHD